MEKDCKKELALVNIEAIIAAMKKFSNKQFMNPAVSCYEKAACAQTFCAQAMKKFWLGFYFTNDS
ncbi:MAG: hypothetical protein VB957_10070 [Pseudomonadales bacterium]|jgi:hypothetical protein